MTHPWKHSSCSMQVKRAAPNYSTVCTAVQSVLTSPVGRRWQQTQAHLLPDPVLGEPEGQSSFPLWVRHLIKPTSLASKPTIARSSQLVSRVSSPAAAATAKSLQSCPSLCDPIDGSPPGSPVPGSLQARTLGGLPFPSPRHESEK